MSNARDIEVIDVRARAPETEAERAERSLRIWGGISYLLHLLVALAAVIPGASISIAVLIVALVMDLVKREDAAGTWHASHFSWRIGSVLWAGFWYVFTWPLYLFTLFFFNPAWIFISIWFLWRIAKGMMRMHQSREVH